MSRKLKSVAGVLACTTWLMLFGAATAAAEGLHHIHLAAGSPTEAVKWYGEHLGCVAIERQPHATLCHGMAVHFVGRPSIGSSQGTGVNHISFAYADVEAKMHALENVGVRGSGVRLQRFADGATVQELPGVFKHGFIFDPWGTRIELVEDAQRQGFHHVHLASVDPDKALDWYAEHIGGERVRFRDIVPGLEIDGVLVLADAYTDGRPARTDERAIDHIAFSFAALGDFVSVLRERGVNAQEPGVPEGARTAAQRAYVSGPDGVLIALVEPHWQGVEMAKTASEVPQPMASYEVPVTPWGEPDLQGMWTGNAAHGIPLERPEDVETDEALTPEQAAARRERGTLGSIWGYEREWRDTTLGYVKSAPSTQVAMIIDPPDGRMPPMTAKGQDIAAQTLAARENPQLPAGPEDLTNYVRCITRGLPALMMPSIYNNGLQILQSPGYVAIQKEMIHETRVIPTSAQPQAGTKLKQWLGHSSGRWEGDTLIVEVRGFNGRAPYMGAGEDLKVTERYRRVSPTKLEYKFTVDDSSIWTRPWTGMFHFDLDNEQYELVEYACHEGNYGMTNILSAARAREQRASESAGGQE